MKTLGVVGLGYVGLPLAVEAATKGYRVVGVDVNDTLIDLVNTRTSPYVNDARFAKALSETSKESLFASNDFKLLSDVENIVICVPTPTDSNVPDLSYVTRAAQQIAEIVRPGQFISLESTVNPGVTRHIVKPALENQSGLLVGKDIFLAHCPERIDPGNERFYVGNLNRVVGGISEDCTKRAVEFYTDVIDAKIIPLGSSEEAEFVKSWENSHRNVMIALANEAAIICDALDMDINNILTGLQSKVDQFGLGLAKPGIGPGGHCIPEDIHYVIREARKNGIDTRFLDSAADLNDKMPKYAVSQLQKVVKRDGGKLINMNVAVLGIAYKENIEDARRSPAIDVAHVLVQQAKSVFIHDPYVKLNKLDIRGTVITDSLEEALENSDAIFIATAHDLYRNIDSTLLKKHNVRYVLDGRNCLNRDELLKNGLMYKGIGR